MIDGWVVKVDTELCQTAGSRMVSGWAKKAQCWDAVRRYVA
jgi:hypothetical protein